MFSLVDVQESFPNINGIEVFNKIFRKSHSAFAESRGSSVQNVWVLPGHIIVSLDEGHKLLSFDLLPKPKPWPDVVDLLNPKQGSKKKGHSTSVFEIFSIGTSPLYMFIVMKNANVHVWKFLHPSFEWCFVCKFNISPVKNSQIMSLMFDPESKTLYWCERRTSTQCSVSKGTISMDVEKDMLTKTTDILRNCPPVQMHVVGPSGVLLRPTANSPIGLTVYWSAASNAVQLHVWNNFKNGIIPSTASSDFQSLITDSISLWIKHNASDPVAVAYCTHPVKQTLLILESTSDLYSSSIDIDGKPILRKLCTLSHTKYGELSQRKTYTMFAFKKFVGLVLEDNALVVFETYKGMLIWCNESLKHERPNTWVSQGVIPRVGFWCPSFVRMLRSESVVKLAEKMLKLDHVQGFSPSEKKNPTEYTLHLTFKGNHGRKKGKETYIVVDQEKDSQTDNNENGNKTNQLVETTDNHPMSESLLLVSEYLRDWKTKNLSSEICLWLLNHPNMSSNDKGLQFSNIEEFLQIFSLFDNPYIALALLHKNPKFKNSLHGMMTTYLSNQKDIVENGPEPSLFSLLKKHCNLTEEINEILMTDLKTRGEDCTAKRTFFRVDFQSQLLNDNLTKQEIFEILQWAVDTHPIEFVEEMKRILHLFNEHEMKIRTNGDDGEINENLSAKLEYVLWRNVLRKDVKSFEILCLGLWEHSPQHLLQFLEKAQTATATSGSGGFLRTTKRSFSVSLADMAKRALKILYRNFKKTLTKERTEILVELILLPETENACLEACKLCLENKLFDAAIRLLESCMQSPVGRDSEQQHYRLFYLIVTALIEERNLGRFSIQLSSMLPANFKLAEFCHIVKGFASATQLCDIFDCEGDIASLGDLQPLLVALVKRGNATGTELIS